MRTRRGWSLVELVVVLSLFTFVLGGLATFVAAQGRMVRAQLEGVRFSEAVRASRLILGSELRPLESQDVVSGSQDSLRVRAFRGGGPICYVSGAQIGVLYSGYRMPDPGKDSVVLASAVGEEYRAVVGVAGPGCDGDGHLLELDGAVTGRPGYALVFETGAYHLANGALRYRRGEGGRQPLIEAILRPAAFREGSGRVEFDAAPAPDSVPTVGFRATVMAPLLNAARP